jgi:uncharacterized membrane protein YdjX (TVP38/TMEM64 family)
LTIKLKSGLVLIFILCLIATGLALWSLGEIDMSQLQVWLKAWGIWAPFVYILLYVIATVLILPSTALNLLGGALFGSWWGTFWTSLAAILAAIAAFAFTRTVGREVVAQRLAGRWQAMDAEVQRGGCFYMFAVRLIPVMPYGLVNFAAGLTSVSFKDYLLGTVLGTVPSVLPFVLLGSSGIRAIKTGDIWPLMLAFALTGILVGGSTWYQHRNRSFGTSSPPHPHSKRNDHEDK